MIELPYKEKFTVLPDVPIEELVSYFNLELGLTDLKEKLAATDFEYLGLYIVDGFERLVWAVEGYDMCAVVKAYEDSYILEMDSYPEGRPVQSLST